MNSVERRDNKEERCQTDVEVLKRTCCQGITKFHCSAGFDGGIVDGVISSVETESSSGRASNLSLSPLLESSAFLSSRGAYVISWKKSRELRATDVHSLWNV